MAKAVYNLDLGGGVIKHTHPEVVTLENDYVSLSIDQTINSDKILNGNVTVNGIFSATSAVFLDVQHVPISGNTIVLNSNLSGVPTTDAFVVVNRGSELDAVVKWNETLDQWEAGLSGSTYSLALENNEVDFSQVNVGNSVTVSNSIRPFNIADTNGIARILSVGLDPSLELIHRDTADGVDNAYWDIGADANDYFYIRKRTGGPVLSAITIDDDLNVTLYGNLNVNYTGTNYDAVSQTLTGQLSGIDLELGRINSITITQASHGFVVGDAIFNDAGTWTKAQSNDADTLGITVVTSVTDTNNFTYSTTGKTQLTSHGFTEGQYLFVSPSVSGKLTETAPIGITEYSNPIAYALDADNLLIFPWRPIQALTRSNDMNITSVSGDYDIIDYDEFVIVDATGGNVEISLPVPSDIYEGFAVVVKKVDTTSNAVNITSLSGNTDGVIGTTGKTIIAPYNSISFVCDGTDYWIQ